MAVAVLAPSGMVVAVANVGAAPGVDVFSRILSVLSFRLTTARSGRPSPLKSPSAIENGTTPVAKVF